MILSAVTVWGRSQASRVISAKAARLKTPSQGAISPRENQRSSEEDRNRSAGAKTNSVKARESPGRR